VSVVSCTQATFALAGCQPVEVVDRVRELGWPGLVGNTDELLWRPEEHESQDRNAPALHELLALLFDEYAPATRDLLGDERIGWLRQLPAEHREGNVVLVHASPGDLWRAPAPDAADAELSTPAGGRMRDSPTASCGSARRMLFSVFAGSGA
jgi:hypothetical protein